MSGTYFLSLIQRYGGPTTFSNCGTPTWFLSAFSRRPLTTAAMAFVCIPRTLPCEVVQVSFWCSKRQLFGKCQRAFAWQIDCSTQILLLNSTCMQCVRHAHFRPQRLFETRRLFLIEQWNPWCLFRSGAYSRKYDNPLLWATLLSLVFMPSLLFFFTVTYDSVHKSEGLMSSFTLGVTNQSQPQIQDAICLCCIGANLLSGWWLLTTGSGPFVSGTHTYHPSYTQC